MSRQIYSTDCKNATEQWRKSLLLLVHTAQGGPIACSLVHFGN